MQTTLLSIEEKHKIRFTTW